MWLHWARTFPGPHCDTVSTGSLTPKRRWREPASRTVSSEGLISQIFADAKLVNMIRCTCAAPAANAARREAKGGRDYADRTFGA
jgi:hypothetical protein